jgi:hypothetical protein
MHATYVVRFIATFLVFLNATFATSIDSNGGPQDVPAGTGHPRVRDPAQYGDPSFEQPNIPPKKLWQLQKNLLDKFIYPNNIQEAKSINSTVFAENVIGRVDVTRDFVGRELNTEYIFGLFASLAESGDTNFLGIPISYEIIHFAASQNVVASSAIVMFKFSTFDMVVPVEQIGFMTFNALGQVSQYDVTFRWFDFLQASIIERAMQMLNISSVADVISFFTLKFATAICDTHDKYCTGSNKQYVNHAACMDFLTHQIRFGASFELGRNTLQCRNLHQIMLPLRPSVHCPHIGPTGGGMCADDSTYAQKVLEPLFMNSPMVPYGLQSPNATIAAM